MEDDEIRMEGRDVIKCAFLSKAAVGLAPGPSADRFIFWENDYMYIVSRSLKTGCAVVNHALPLVYL